ncbi:MAG: hypothetical protein KC478_17515 [Bacteriovoracaceae bacterium]|nr:hypothetical protein [Bacteriovoracaceae bacterium]
MKKFISITLLFLLVVSCSSSTKRKIREPRYSESKWTTEPNTANLINMFYSKFWNKSFNELYESSSKTKYSPRTILLPDQAFKSDGRVSHFCAAHKVDGEPSPVFVVNFKKDYKKNIVFNGINLGVAEERCKYFSMPSRTSNYKKIDDGAIYVKDAATIKKMLVEVGVPLLFCHEGSMDKVRLGYYNTHVTKSEGKKSFRCALEGKQKNKALGTYISFSVDYGVLTSFSMGGLKLSNFEKKIPFKDVFYNRFKSQSYIRELQKEIARSYNRSQAHANKTIGQSKHYNRQARSHQRKIEAGRARAFSKSLAKGTSNVFDPNDPIEKAKRKTMSDIAAYQNSMRTSRASSRKKNSSGSNLTLTSTSAPEVKPQPKSENCKMAQGHAVKGPYAPDGQKWCGYEGILKREEERKALVKSQTNPKNCPMPIAKDVCAQDGYGKDHCRTTPKGKYGSCVTGK